MQISERNPLIITSEDALESVMVRVFKRMGIVTADVVKKEPVITELPTAAAKKLLTQKGYRVNSWEGFNRVVKDHDIRFVTRGKEHWYLVDDLNRLPAKV